MRILIISQYYWPEDFAAGVYICELAETLAKKGHQVTVLTAFPHYPEGRIQPQYKGRLFQIEQKTGVRIIRSFIHAVPRDRPLRFRILTHISFALSALMAMPFTDKQDVIYVHMPLLPLGYMSLFTSYIRRIPCVLGVKDLSAEALVQAGKVTLGIGFKIIEKCERQLYKIADHIQVPGLRYKQHLLKWDIPESKITVIPDWADHLYIQPMFKYNEFRKSQGLMDKFIILYSGNMGYSSDLETVLKAAMALESIPNIHFLLIGDGVKRAGIEQKATEWKLSNVTFLPFQPRETFPQVLAAADICLLTLNHEFTGVAAQGKMYNIMAAGRPLLALMDQEACGADLIIAENIGKVVAPGDFKTLAGIINEWKDAPELLASFGQRARRLLEERFTVDICTKQFEDLFNRVITE